ncbi:unnamed protein product [Larinioides sclopetarius]|uniref:C2H2-type domain-containing protein n=1 Tax=Larinioides sclopetarius TaxID=280406 RepID=A0AAV2BUD5_9ARAC
MWYCSFNRQSIVTKLGWCWIQDLVCIMAILHNGKKAFRCNICEYTCTRLSWAKIHTRVHTGDKPFECEFCGQRFTWYNTYKKHLKLCDAVKGDLVPLSSVGKKVKDDSVPLLSVGKKVMDDVVPPSLVGKKVKDDMVTPSLVSKKVKDDSVPPSSAGKKMKDDMVSTSLVGKKVKYDKAPSSSDDKKTQLKKIFKCNICGKEFLEEEACRWHLSFCSENLKTQKVLETFLNPEAPWQCSFCGKNFDDDQLYLSHSASCNQDIKEQKDSEMMIPFVETEVLKCEFCGKRCENIGVWTKHTAHCSSKSKTIQIVEDILELNEKRSECYFCHEKFANETDCRNHLASCSQISPEENWPYKCELCDKGFIYRGRLTRHLNFCSERFKTQQIVEEILKSNEKTFECHFCKKKFENETNYMNHSISCDNNPETQLAVQELLKLGLSE